MCLSIRSLWLLDSSESLGKRSRYKHMLKRLEGLSEEDKVLVIEEAFNQVARTENGKIVFAVILENLYFFRSAETPAQQALCNFAKFLINYFGEDAKYRAVAAILGKEQSNVK